MVDFLRRALFSVQNHSNKSMKMEKCLLVFTSLILIYNLLYFIHAVLKDMCNSFNGKNSHMMHRGNNTAALHIRISSKRN